jgi:hypothetical protein
MIRWVLQVGRWQDKLYPVYLSTRYPSLISHQYKLPASENRIAKSQVAGLSVVCQVALWLTGDLVLAVLKGNGVGDIARQTRNVSTCLFARD